MHAQKREFSLQKVANFQKTISIRKVFFLEKSLKKYWKIMPISSEGFFFKMHNGIFFQRF